MYEVPAWVFYDLGPDLRAQLVLRNESGADRVGVPNFTEYPRKQWDISWL